MDAFSYLSVLLSIIIGLAITEVLQGYRRLLLARGRVRAGNGAALLWSALLILFATQAWWASFGLRDYQQWSFVAFAVILLQMILLYMMAAVVLPHVEGSEPVDLGEHFDRHRRAFFGFLVGLLAVSITKDVVLNGALPSPANLLFHLSLALAAVAGALVRSSKAQLLIALFAAAGFAVYIGILFARL
jgi:hypothetical protein